ncbi:MAG: class I SAM-dependent methyltransferase [Saprospiraceae bacterium]|nr:class I SAM-dependent methyltransferase [Saprospiraceae bacterium]
MKNRIFNYLPAPLRSVLRQIYFFLGELYDRLLGNTQEMIPPKRMIFVGPGDFQNIGNHFFQIFINQGGLKNKDKVLDVGCGIGRMAVPLTGFLHETGVYEGFDIVPEAIRWCRHNITPKFKNFHFIKADIYNQNYNPSGRLRATEFRFPYEEGQFDFIFLTSVFTHMIPEEIEHYFSEISRVLKNNGTCLITFFLENVESRAFMDAGKSALNFKFQFPGFSSTNSELPESAVCFSEDYITGLYQRNHLIISSTDYGGWSGRKPALSHHDIIIAKKS